MASPFSAAMTGLAHAAMRLDILVLPAARRKSGSSAAGAVPRQKASPPPRNHDYADSVVALQGIEDITDSRGHPLAEPVAGVGTVEVDRCDPVGDFDRHVESKAHLPEPLGHVGLLRRLATPDLRAAAATSRATFLTTEVSKMLGMMYSSLR